MERELSVNEVFDDLTRCLLHVDDTTLLEEATLSRHLRQELICCRELANFVVLEKLVMLNSVQECLNRSHRVI